MGKYTDLTGLQFGRLTVIAKAKPSIRTDGKPRTRWRCRCECGNEIIVNGDNLTRGNTVSCGCYQKDITSNIKKTHGKTNTRLYSVWSGIKSRCYNKNVYEYRWYGARGITMCDEWKADFDSFYNWSIANGYDETAPRGSCTIDRIDANQGYSPENCRFVSQQQQMNNIHTNHIISCDGETHTIAEWSRITGISQFKIRNRIAKLGWSPERALQTI